MTCDGAPAELFFQYIGFELADVARTYCAAITFGDSVASGCVASTRKLASLCLLLLVMQRDDGFHSGGAYGRDEARNGCDDGQQQRDGGVGWQVDGCDAEQLSAQEAGQDNGERQADEEPDARHAQPLRHD